MPWASADTFERTESAISGSRGLQDTTTTIRHTEAIKGLIKVPVFSICSFQANYPVTQPFTKKIH
jgi:hypothetical protein